MFSLSMTAQTLKFFQLSFWPNHLEHDINKNSNYFPFSPQSNIIEVRIVLIITRRRNPMLPKRFQNILIPCIQPFIRLTQLFLTLQINLITLIMILSLLDPILQLKHWYLKSLFLNLCKPDIYWRKLFLVFGFFDQAEVAVEVALVLLLFA